MRASYTFSKSVDDVSSHSGDSPQYGLLRTLDRGLSDFDIRHRLTINYFYALPLGSGQRWWDSGLLAHVFGGWRLGGIFRFRTGTPSTPEVNVRTTGYLFAATRPNLVPGQNNNPTVGVTAGCEGVEAGQKLGSPELYFDPCVYSVPSLGTLGNAGRNTLLAPSVLNMDVSLQREFLLDAKRRLQFRAEFFNLPNHPNFNGSTGGMPLLSSRVRPADEIPVREALIGSSVLPGRFSLRCDSRSEQIAHDGDGESEVWIVPMYILVLHLANA